MKAAVMVGAVLFVQQRILDLAVFDNLVAGPTAYQVREPSAYALGVPRPGDPVPLAYAGDPWYPGFRQDLRWVMDEHVAWEPLAVQRVRDVVTPTVNVRDRVRTSWTAPACSCRRVTVWMYGGSAAFGLGQRDDHTIASELARLAADDGVTLDVQNRGMPGAMHWRNSTRFSWDLSFVESSPDLVVFYEGAEEVESALALDARRLGNTIAPFESFLSDLYDETALVPDTPISPPPGVAFLGWPRADDQARTPGVLASERYGNSLQMSDATAAHEKLPVRYFWQPSRFDVEHPQDLDRPESRRQAAFAEAAASVPTDVVNLSGALAEVPGPLFSDDSNHNEVAARAIAVAMWADLRDSVQAIADGDGR